MRISNNMSIPARELKPPVTRPSFAEYLQKAKGYYNCDGFKGYNSSQGKYTLYVSDTEYYEMEEENGKNT